MRCIRAVKSLGALEGSELQVIALYTDVDRDAPFVRHADIAVRLPTTNGRAVAAYLDYDLLIKTLKQAQADAVWPGWGFVSEHADFAQRVADAGMRFLGPKPAVMRALGDKISSKFLAEEADVPVTPWSNGVVADVAAAQRWGEEIGYPLVIKASAGGGGRGIRVVRNGASIADLFRSAAAEAKGAFGDDRLFMEQMVEGGRHVEVQIVADLHGNVVALGCRDCSVQRRHQKILEEAPPVGLPPLMLRALKDSAASLARQAGYTGVGTVEFLVRGPDFFFLEMNPRLQVEHGITEEITGTDIVQLQIRIARGEPLPDLDWPERGFSIEARVCAEDPDAGFVPAPGRIARFDPAFGPRLRIDTGVAPESSVPADFDSLIAKVIASGDTREEARARLVCALRDFDLVIEGGSTNKSYLLEILDTDAFKQGGVDTNWLDRWNEQRSSIRKYAAEALVLAAIVAYQQKRQALTANFFADTGNVTPDKIPRSTGQQIELTYAGFQPQVHVYAHGLSRYRVHWDGRAVAAQLSVSGSHAARLKIGGQDLRVLYDLSDATIRVEVEGRVHKFGRQTAGLVSVATPSLVVAIHVKDGDRVEAGQALGLLEAMKMEIRFDAPISGTVREVRVRRGQQVRAGDVLLVIDPASDGESQGPDSRATLRLPDEADPLSVLFSRSGEPLSKPDLDGLRLADADELSRALSAVNDEIRHIVLGYDAFESRVKSLIAFLDAPLPAELAPELATKLAEVRQELVVFADIEQLFTRRQTVGEQGELHPSNNAHLHTFLRRMRTRGAGLDEAFLARLHTALAHYGVHNLDYNDALERVVLRLFASQAAPELRFRLVTAVLHRVTNLVEAGLDLRADIELKDALLRIAALRGQVPDSLADAVSSASYRIFQRPELERAIDHTTQRLERWLAEAETTETVPPEHVLRDLAVAPLRRFRPIEGWLSGAHPQRQAVATAAYVRRLYVPRLPLPHSPSQAAEGTFRMLLGPGDVVLARVAKPAHILDEIRVLCRQVRREESAKLELLVPLDSFEQREGAIAVVDTGLAQCLAEAEGARGPISAERLTLSFVVPGLGPSHETWYPSGSGITRAPLFGLHPEAAARVELARYQSFHLERINAAEDIYCFHGRSKDIPDDERVFVLADTRDRPTEDGEDAALFVPSFERAFHEAARTLRLILATRDPRRQLHWNRIAIFLAHPIVLDRSMAQRLAQRLHPATRHLGLERVMVRLKVLDQHDPKRAPHEVELVVSDLFGGRLDVTWREPHRAPLLPVSDYVRRVVRAKRRGLIYPYELLRMLAVSQEDAEADSIRTTTAPPAPLAVDRLAPLAQGRFDEYDLDPKSKTPRAIPVPGRAPGKNTCAIVFGLITTPTMKFPEGMRRVLILSDPTRDMGALAAPECDRVVAAIDLAEQLSLPVEWVPVSSGARIAMNSGTENLDATARVVKRIVTFTQAGGTIHIIVSGVNVGAQSYWDSLATMLLYTRGVLIMTPRASMVLTGRAALEASGSVSADDETSIGGYERVMGPNGQAQYFAGDLGDAYRILYEHYNYTYVAPGERGPRRLPTSDPTTRNILEHPYKGEGFSTIGELFSDATNPGRKKPFSMRALMAALIDHDGGSLERWQSLAGGETAIVWDAHLGGQPICLIGIESQNVPRWGYRPLDGPADWNGGTLFPQSSKKIARALNAASGNRPTVILANLSGFDGSPESMRNLQLEYGAEIARAVVNYQGPLIFLVVSRYHGGAYVVFSRELNPALRASAVEGSYASVIGGGPAAAVVFAREVGARVLSDERVKARREQDAGKPASRNAWEQLLEAVRLEKQAELAAEFDAIHTVERARDVGSLEGIVPAASIRQRIIDALEHPSSL